MNKFCDLVDTEEVKELEDADLAVFNLAEKGESENSYEGDHSDRDERDQVHEQLRLVRRLDCVLLDIALLDQTERVQKCHPILEQEE